MSLRAGIELEWDEQNALEVVRRGPNPLAVVAGLLGTLFVMRAIPLALQAIG